MHDDKTQWDEALGAALIGKIVLVGMTRGEGGAMRDEQLFGTVERADAGGVELLLGGMRAGDRFRLPPDPRAFCAAAPGSYRLRSTGEIVTDPDFTATWTILDAEGG